MKRTKKGRYEPIVNASALNVEGYLEVYGGRNEFWGVKALIPNNECIEFRQKIDYTWDVIVATIGGTMEFWIGAGLLSLVQILLFVIDHVCLKS